MFSAKLSRATVFLNSAIALIILGGCASLLEKRVALEPSAIFSARGKIIVQSDGKKRSAKFFWRRKKNGDGFADSVQILSLIGTSLAKIELSSDGAFLQTPDAEFRAADADLLMEQALGWRLPLTGLGDWIQGRAHERSESKIVGRSIAQIIRQDGWTVELDGHDENSRPREVFLTRRKFRKEISVKITITEWRTES